MDSKNTQGREEQSGPDVFPVPYRPWFVPRSLKGRLFQLWMVVFFLLTYVVVSTDVLSQISVLGLPGNMGWIYLGEICTIAVLVLTYYGHWRERAEHADQQVEAILKEEMGEADRAGEDTSQRGASASQ